MTPSYLALHSNILINDDGNTVGIGLLMEDCNRSEEVLRYERGRFKPSLINQATPSLLTHDVEVVTVKFFSGETITLLPGSLILEANKSWAEPLPGRSVTTLKRNLHARCQQTFIKTIEAVTRTTMEFNPVVEFHSPGTLDSGLLFMLDDSDTPAMIPVLAPVA